MDAIELFIVRCQLQVLKELQKDYGHKTLDNVVQSLEAREKILEKNCGGEPVPYC